ncbi:hypothetical protein Csa_019789 [Cucumis sativus]|uniref:Uncharacterized protein n=1 Tax=Cucumis sativus TaxID=3659 RepID=A0A0A0LUX2_CUCSA|nr:hypothetical protein Csa_019789 [Cucumis sativus]
MVGSSGRQEPVFRSLFRLHLVVFFAGISFSGDEDLKFVLFQELICILTL